MEGLINKYANWDYCKKVLNMLEDGNKFDEFQQLFYGNLIYDANYLANTLKDHGHDNSFIPLTNWVKRFAIELSTCEELFATMLIKNDY